MATRLQGTDKVVLYSGEWNMIKKTPADDKAWKSSKNENRKDLSGFHRHLRYILGQKRNAAYKDLKYYALNEIYTISSAINVSLLFLPHFNPIVLLSSVNPNQCTGCLFTFKFSTCTFISFRFPHVITTEITSLYPIYLKTVLKIHN